MATRLRWGRILLGGVFIELAMFAVFIPLMSISETAAYVAVPIWGMVTAVLFGRWAAGPAGGRWVLHGGLTAAFASLLWGTMVVASGGFATTPVLYHVVNVLRVLAGMAGGAWAERRASARQAPALS